MFNEAFFHKTKALCPALATFIKNCCSIPSDPSVKGRKHLKSLEETTLRDLEAMAIYALGTAPLLRWLWRFSKVIRKPFPSRQVAFADDLNGVGSLGNLRKWWERVIYKNCFKMVGRIIKIIRNCKEIATTAYAAFTSECKHKCFYSMRNINCISNFMFPVAKVISEKLITTLFDGFPISREFRK